MPATARPRLIGMPDNPGTRRDVDLILMRSIVEFFGSWQSCNRACRRRKSCAHPDIACFDANLAAIRTELRDLADWPRLDGPRAPEDDAAPAVNMWD